MGYITEVDLLAGIHPQRLYAKTLSLQSTILLK